MATETWYLVGSPRIPLTNETTGKYGESTIFNASFVSDGNTYKKISLYPNIMYSPYSTISYDGTTIYKTDTGFYKNNYRQLTFLNSSEISTALRKWLQSNALRQSGFTGEIFQDSKTATILKVGGKYCDRDIYIYPNLQEKSTLPMSASQAIVADDGYVGLSKVTVAATPLQSKAGTPKSVSQTFTPDSGYVGLSSFQIEAVPTQDETLGANGTFLPDEGKFFGAITVKVPPYEDVSTADEMTAKLVAANVGKVYRFVGTTDSTYINGDLYEVEGVVG